MNCIFLHLSGASGFSLTPTNHALTRMQQRGIPSELLQIILQQGKKLHARGDANLFLLPKDKIHQLGESFSRYRDKLSKLPYAVVKNGRIITVGLRHRKIKQKPNKSRRRTRGRGR